MAANRIATRYIVSGTTNTEERLMSNLTAAKKFADARAAAEGEIVRVETQQTGRLSHLAEPEFIEIADQAEVESTLAAEDEFEALVAEVVAERETVAAEAEEKVAEALLPVVKAPAKARREALGECVVGGGWELLYDKPRQGCQVGRRQGVYALICVAHLTVHRLERLVDERAARKAGGWCPDCQH